MMVETRMMLKSSYLNAFNDWISETNVWSNILLNIKKVNLAKLTQTKNTKVFSPSWRFHQGKNKYLVGGSEFQ